MSSTVYIPSGAPTFLHLHLKPPFLPVEFPLNSEFPVNFSATDEMDMYLNNHSCHDEVGNKHSPLSIVGCIIFLQEGQASCGLEFSARPSFNTLGRNGKANFLIQLTSSKPALASQVSFYLEWSIPSHPAILPVISGPHRIAQKASAQLSDQTLHAFKTINKPKPKALGLSAPVVPASPAVVPFIVIRELCGVHLGGRIWDCSQYLKNFLIEHVFSSNIGISWFQGKKILELGSGTGVLGLWLAKFLQSHPGESLESPETVIQLSDQEEAMEILRENINRNAIFRPEPKPRSVEGMEIPTTSDEPPAPPAPVVHTVGDRLEFGSAADAAALSLQPPFDFVIGSDVIFNPRYFDALLLTLQAVCHAGTRVLFAYRPRSVEELQDRPFFQGAKKLGIHLKPKAKYNNVFILMAEAQTEKPGEEKQGKS